MSVSGIDKRKMFIEVDFKSKVFLAFEQALRGALEEEGELTTTSLEVEYLHRESRCEVLIGRDDINNDVITLCHVFFSVCLHWRSFLLRVDWWKSDSSVDGKPQGNWKWNSNSRNVVVLKLSFLFPPCRHSAPESLLAA